MEMYRVTGIYDISVRHRDPYMFPSSHGLDFEALDLCNSIATPINNVQSDDTLYVGDVVLLNLLANGTIQVIKIIEGKDLISRKWKLWNCTG